MNALSPHQLQFQTLLRGWQPGSLPVGVWESSAGTLAPGVGIYTSSSIISRVGPVDVHDRFVLVHGPDATARDAAMETITEMGWQVAPDRSYRLTPPNTLEREVAAEQTIRSLVALSRLMPPGMTAISRRVIIEVSDLQVQAAEALREGVEACAGLGLGLVHMLGLKDPSVHTGTVVPILVHPALLTTVYPVELARTLINYMAAVTAPGQSAGPYEFHVVIDHSGTTPKRAHDLLETLQDDPLLASGAGWVSQVAWYGGLLLAGAGVLGIAGYGDPVGLTEPLSALRTIAEGSLLASGMAVYRHGADRRSRETPFKSTPFRITIWPSADSHYPSPLTLHRTARNNGTMQTQIEKTG